MYRNLICLEEITKEGCVCKTDAGCGDKVILHFDDCGLLALKIKVISNFTACKTAADNCNIFANFFIAEKIINRFNGGFNILYRKWNWLSGISFNNVLLREVFKKC